MHIYPALMSKECNGNCYANWGKNLKLRGKNPSVSKAGPASDLQSYWLVKSQFGCGGPQKNSWAARACMYNSIHKMCYEASGAVSIWSIPIRCPHLQRWRVHSFRSGKPLKSPRSRQLSLCHLKYKLCMVTTPVVSWAAISKPHLVVLHICN